MIDSPNAQCLPEYDCYETIIINYQKNYHLFLLNLATYNTRKSQIDAMIRTTFPNVVTLQPDLRMVER